MSATKHEPALAGVESPDAGAAARRAAAHSLISVLTAKDGYTAEHASSIAEPAVDTGRELGLTGIDLDDLRYAATLHDIGKIAVPDAILNKPGRLTAEEFEVIKRHPVTGEQILLAVPELRRVLPVVRHSHEHWDGSGYPDGLCGEEIPFGSRIVLVADAYHAMTSDRPYRKAMSHAQACEELRRDSGTKLDPIVVDAFLSVLKRRRAQATSRRG